MPSIKKLHKPLKPGFDQLHRAAATRSVRTSFRLSDAAGEALAWMAKRLDTTQKDLMTTLVNDLVELRTATPRRFNGIVRKALKHNESGSRRAYVIDRDALDQLRDLARRTKCSRDALLEVALEQYYEATAKAELKYREDRAEALTVVRDVRVHADSASADLLQHLDARDPIRTRFDAILEELANIESELILDIEPDAPEWAGAATGRTSSK